MSAESKKPIYSELECVRTKATYILDHTPFTICRARDADIICTSFSTSRKHCKLFKNSEGKWCVTDLGSSGTFINKKYLKAGLDYVINDGDILQVGDPDENLAWTFKLAKPVTENQPTKEEENMKLEIQRLREALDAEQKRCEQKIKEQKEALEIKLLAKDLELDNVKANVVTDVTNSLIPDLQQKEAERDALHVLLDELNENLERTIAQGKREKELAEWRFREQQEQLLKLNQAKQQIEGSLSEELKKKQEAEEKLKQLTTAVAQTSSADSAVSKNTVEEILESELQCGICSELFITAITLNCTHTFCRLCLKQWKKKICPYCRATITSENRALVLDNYIQKMVDSLSEDFRTRRSAIVEERRRAESTTPARGRGRVRRGRAAARRRGVEVAYQLNGDPQVHALNLANPVLGLPFVDFLRGVQFRLPQVNLPQNRPGRMDHEVITLDGSQLSNG